MNLFRDFIYPLTGIALLTIGAAMIYHPAGFLVAGLCFLFVAMIRPKAQ